MTRARTFQRVLLAAVMAVALPAVPAAAERAERKSYIVVLKDSVSQPRAVARAHVRATGGKIGHVYRHAVKGYSATLPVQAVERLESDGRVAFVEEDRAVQALGHGVNAPTGVSRAFATSNPNLAIDGHDDKRVDVDIAILDTGILSSHRDLNVVGGRNCSRGTSWEDGNGHGTHVAGTAAGIDNGNGAVGMAPGARLWAARVLDNSGSGSWSSVICGIDWVTGLKHGDGTQVIEVANMSLSGSGSEPSNPGGDMEQCNPGTGSSLYNSICKSVRAGVTYAVAAGNESANASGSVPAGYRSVITVSALADFDGLAGGLSGPTCRSDTDDTFASFSNYGSAVDLIAPGVCITSAWKDGAYKTISGTSMASPHVAGAAALLKSRDPSSAPSAVRQTLQNSGNLGWDNSDDRDSTKESLLDVGNSTTFNPVKVDGSEAPVETTPQAPVAEFTASCTLLECSFTDRSSDSDGTIASWNWAFGDGTSSTAQNPKHTYGGDDTYQVSLTVTDNSGMTGTTSQYVTVSSSAPAVETLGVSVEKVGSTTKKGPWYHADLQVTVTDGNGPVSGATVAFDVYSGDTCSGSSSSGSGTTASDGTLTFTFKSRTTGTYCAAATASKDGYESGSGSANFTL